MSWKNITRISSTDNSRVGKRKRSFIKDPLLIAREEAVTSLFNALVQAWKAWDARGGNLESTNGGGQLIASVLRNLNIGLTLTECKRSNQSALRYDDAKLIDYLGQLYDSCEKPLEVMTPKIIKYALDTTDRIVDLCRAVGYKAPMSKEWFLETDQHYALLFLTRVWGANLKYNSQYLFSYYEGLEPLPQPDTLVGKPGWLCYGRPGSSIRRRCEGSSQRAREVRMTLLQGFKKSLLPLEREDWKTTVCDTQKSLTSESPDMTDEVYQEMIRTGDELAKRTPKLRVRQNYKVSNSACIDNTRSNGGFAGEFFNRNGIRTFTRAERDSGILRSNCLGVVYRISPPYLVGDRQQKGTSYVSLVYSRCALTYSDLYDEYLPGAMAGSAARVKVRVIPEPFKFRVISIGEFDTYGVLKPYQRMLWDTLQKFECFCLTGSGADDLLYRTEAVISKYWDVGMKFLSGDYKGATNYLSSFASKVLLGQWMKKYPEFLVMMENSLFSSHLDFTDCGKGVEDLLPGTECGGISFEDDKLMSNGQLMGHPCSFPILCAVNAGICRMVLEKVWGRKFTLDEIPLLINGDDCLLVGPERLLPEWRERTKEVGLIESVGKSYFTDKFAMINSRYLQVEAKAVYDVDWPACPSRYQAFVTNDVGYVNLGILNGRKKGSNVDCEVGVLDKVDEKSCYLLWQSAKANFEQMNLRCKSLRVGLWEYLERYKRFFSNSCLSCLPLFLAPELGGFGFRAEDVAKDLECPIPEWVDLSLLGDAALYPKRFFRKAKSDKVMLGEAYYCGGLSTCFDDGDWYGFEEEAMEVAPYYSGQLCAKSNLLTCDPEVCEPFEWSVTVLK